MEEDLLMWEQEQSDEQEIQHRTELIRGLAQGRGILNPAFDELVSADVLQGLEAEDQATLIRRIDRAMELLVSGPHVQAIKNALGMLVYKSDELKYSTLTERRNWFIEHESKISYRTLIRHEQEGARALAVVMRVGASRSRQTVEELNQRVIDLERMVAWLIGLQGEPLPDYSFLNQRDDAFLAATKSRHRLLAQATLELENELKDQREDHA